MGRVIPITEQFQHFLEEVKEGFWGDLYGKTKLLWKGFWEEQSRRERDRFLGAKDHERVGKREYRNGFYERHFVKRHLRTGWQRFAGTRIVSG